MDGYLWQLPDDDPIDAHSLLLCLPPCCDSQRMGKHPLKKHRETFEIPMAHPPFTVYYLTTQLLRIATTRTQWPVTLTSPSGRPWCMRCLRIAVSSFIIASVSSWFAIVYPMSRSKVLWTARPKFQTSFQHSSSTAKAPPHLTQIDLEKLQRIDETKNERPTMFDTQCRRRCA